MTDQQAPSKPQSREAPAPPPPAPVDPRERFLKALDALNHPTTLDLHAQLGALKNVLNELGVMVRASWPQE